MCSPAGETRIPGRRGEGELPEGAREAGLGHAPLTTEDSLFHAVGRLWPRPPSLWSATKFTLSGARRSAHGFIGRLLAAPTTRIVPSPARKGQPPDAPLASPFGGSAERSEAIGACLSLRERCPVPQHRAERDVGRRKAPPEVSFFQKHMSAILSGRIFCIIMSHIPHIFSIIRRFLSCQTGFSI